MDFLVFVSILNLTGHQFHRRCSKPKTKQLVKMGRPQWQLILYEYLQLHLPKKKDICFASLESLKVVIHNDNYKLLLWMIIIKRYPEIKTLVFIEDYLASGWRVNLMKSRWTLSLNADHFYYRGNFFYIVKKLSKKKLS